MTYVRDDAPFRVFGERVVHVNHRLTRGDGTGRIDPYVSPRCAPSLDYHRTQIRQDGGLVPNCVQCLAHSFREGP